MVPAAVLSSPAIYQKPTIAPSRGRAAGIVESWTVALVLAGLIALHVAYAFVYRVDSDEPQHLHVVWGVAQGLVQYRDIFDNHSPLFQMLCAPLMAAIGEHAWIVIPMRMAMTPLYIADLLLVWLIARSLYPRQWAPWMAIVTGCVPLFFLVTTEFRPDDLWTTLWLAAVWVAVGGPLEGRRAFLFGLLMGFCFSVSMKTMLLFAAAGTAGAGLLALHALSRRKLELRALLKNGGLILTGLVIVPGLLVAFFAAHGPVALRQMYYCVIQHNFTPGLGKGAKAGFHLWLFPLSLAPLFGLGWLCMHSSADERIGGGRALIAMTCVAYYFLLRSYWPLVTTQDAEPMLPLLALSVLPFLFHLLSLPKWNVRAAIPAAAALLLAVEAALIWRMQSPLDNKVIPFNQDLAAVLRLTNPTDLVMDGKGESIFRNRPIYWVLEGVTIKRIQLGLIPDDVKEKIINTSTCVALDHRLRGQDSDWLHQNFLEGDHKVWVAGKKLGPVRPTIAFHTDIQARYSIVSDKGKLAGKLDGAPLRDSQQIAAGDHLLELNSGAGNVALVWSQALERGFSPFAKATPEDSE